MNRHATCRNCGEEIRLIPLSLSGEHGWRHRTQQTDGVVQYRRNCYASTVAEPEIGDA